MKLITLILLAVMSLMNLSPRLFAVIIETPHFSDLTQYVTKTSLVLLDVDDTLLLPTQTLGTDVWFIHRYTFHLNSSKTQLEALDKALAEWEAVRHLTGVKIVEIGTDLVVRRLQDDQIPVMGLTTQGLALTTRTLNQLHSLNIDLSRTAPSREDWYFSNGHGVLYRQGLLATSGTAKGKALLKLLDLIGYEPELIVFINDKATHLRDVEEAVESRGIEFIGLRYSYGDDRVANFDPALADIQWRCSTFGHILSDEQAQEELLKEGLLDVR